MLVRYETVNPTERINPRELISLKLVKARRRKENTVVAQDKRTESDESFLQPARNTE